MSDGERKVGSVQRQTKKDHERAWILNSSSPHRICWREGDLLNQEPPSPRQWEGAGLQGGRSYPTTRVPALQRDSESRNKYEKAGEDELEMEGGINDSPKRVN